MQELPVLIYGSKDGCGACMGFEPEWGKICRQLQGRARLVRFNCSRSRPAPKPLRKYMTWYPSIFLAGPNSYFKCFTPDDRINEAEYSDDYEIRARKFNAIETDKGYQYAGGDNSAQQVVEWFEQVSPTVSSFDEPY